MEIIKQGNFYIDVWLVYFILIKNSVRYGILKIIFDVSKEIFDV